MHCVVGVTAALQLRMVSHVLRNGCRTRSHGGYNAPELTAREQRQA
ncbi:MAG: hypothetical protein RL033_6201, partial [Pseudomonadota bacterium]